MPEVKSIPKRGSAKTERNESPKQERIENESTKIRHQPKHDSLMVTQKSVKKQGSSQEGASITEPDSTIMKSGHIKFLSAFADQQEKINLDINTYSAGGRLSRLGESDMFSQIYSEEKLTNKEIVRRNAALLTGEHGHCIGTGEVATWIGASIRRTLLTGLPEALNTAEKVRIQDRLELILPRIDIFSSLKSTCRHLSVCQIVFPDIHLSEWLPAQSRCSLYALSALRNFKRIILPCDFVMQEGMERPSHATSVVIEQTEGNMFKLHHFETNGQRRPSLKKDPVIQGRLNDEGIEDRGHRFTMADFPPEAYSSQLSLDQHKTSCEY